MTEDSYSRTEETAETVTRGGSGRVAIPVHCMLTSTGVSTAGSHETCQIEAITNLCKVAACLAITYFVS